jgi:hypothetical protein
MNLNCCRKLCFTSYPSISRRVLSHLAIYHLSFYSFITHTILLCGEVINSRIRSVKHTRHNLYFLSATCLIVTIRRTENVSHEDYRCYQICVLFHVPVYF